MPKKLLLAIIVVVLCVLIAVAVFHIPKPDTTKPAIPTPTVTTKALQYQVIPQSVMTYGQTVSPKSTSVRAQSDGELTGLFFTPGEAVKKGQLLFTLKTSSSDSQLKQLQAQMQLSKQIYKRTQDMARRAAGSVSTVDLLKAKLQYQQDLARYQQAQDIYNIRAPIDGVVSDTDYAKGDYVQSGTDLVQVIDMQSLQLRYQLPSRYAKQVRKGQVVVFTPTDSTHTYRASVTYVAPLLNSDAADFTVRANFIDNAKLMVNRFGRIKQYINQHYRTLAVPQNLVQSDSQGFYVFLLKDNKVHQQYFNAGEVTKSGMVEVKAGLPFGAVLITTNPHSLQAGQKVKVAK